MNEKRFIYLSYFLVIVGYMTLTLSLPLLQIIPRKVSYISLEEFHYGISLLFLMFAISAGTLSRVADIIGPHRILATAQVCSIVGLLVLAFTQATWMFYLGFILMGSGTGCYSSIGRLLVAKYSGSHEILRKSFSIFSMLIVIAPLLSSHLALISNAFDWRLAYIIMAIIEVLLLTFAFFILRKDKTENYSHNFKSILTGYFYCLKEPNYFFNLLFVGLGLAAIITILLGNADHLFRQDLHISIDISSWIILGVSFSYIIGIIFFRFLPERAPFNLIRALFIFLLLGTSIWLYFDTSIYSILIAIYLFCLALGYIVPLSTSDGLLNIHEHQGAASAIYTVSFALFSSIWSILQTNLGFDTKAFIVLALFVTSCIFIVLMPFAHIFKPKKLT